MRRRHVSCVTLSAHPVLFIAVVYQAVGGDCSDVTSDVSGGIAPLQVGEGLSYYDDSIGEVVVMSTAGMNATPLVELM